MAGGRHVLFDEIAGGSPVGGQHALTPELTGEVPIAGGQHALYAEMTFKDPFNRADNPADLSGTGALPWVYFGPGTAVIVNNQATFTDLDGVNPTGAVMDTGSPDKAVALTFAEASVEMGMIFRGDAVGQDYWVARRSGLYIYEAGVGTLVTSYSTTSSGARLSVALSGSSIVLTRNSTEIANITDARHSDQSYAGLWRR